MTDQSYAPTEPESEEDSSSDFDMSSPEDVLDWLASHAYCPNCSGPLDENGEPENDVELDLDLNESGAVVVSCPDCGLKKPSSLDQILKFLPGPTSVHIVARRAITTHPTAYLSTARTALRALANVEKPGPETFASMGDLVAVDTDAGRAVQLNSADLREKLAQAALWEDPQGTRTDPPVGLALEILKLSKYPEIPQLERVVNAPIYTADGQLLSTPGYSKESRTVLVPNQLGDCTPPENPTPQELAAAVELIATELLGDFPFASDSDRANAFGLTVLPYVRDLIDGPTPLHFVTAPEPGTGKGKLLASALAPSLGEFPSQAWSKSDEEMNKSLISSFRAGAQIINFDNVRGQRIKSEPLEAALTQSTYSSRLLRSSTQLTFPVRSIFVATGNNATLSRDLARRTVPIRLDARVQTPSARSGPKPGTQWRHPLPSWAMANRGELTKAVLTVVQAWISAGKPAAENPQTFGSFEAYAEVLGGILSHAGISGFLDNRHEATTTDTGDDDAWLEALLPHLAKSWPDGATSAELFTDPVVVELMFEEGAAPASSAKIGRRLRDHIDRVVGGLALRRLPRSNGSQTKWQAEPITEGEQA